MNFYFKEEIGTVIYINNGSLMRAVIDDVDNYEICAMAMAFQKIGIIKPTGIANPSINMHLLKGDSQYPYALVVPGDKFMSLYKGDNICQDIISLFSKSSLPLYEINEAEFNAIYLDILSNINQEQEEAEDNENMDDESYDFIEMLESAFDEFMETVGSYFEEKAEQKKYSFDEDTTGDRGIIYEVTGTQAVDFINCAECLYKFGGKLYLEAKKGYILDEFLKRGNQNAYMGDRLEVTETTLNR